MKVKRISAQDTYELRHKVLRPQGKLEDCRFAGDEDELTFHLGAFEEKRLVSIATFCFHSHKDIPEKNQFRLRGMATHEEYRGKGLSSALLKTAFPLIEQSFCHTIWCNARLNAIGFYEKLGFITQGEIFDIPGVGPHKLMLKHLQQS